MFKLSGVRYLVMEALATDYAGQHRIPHAFMQHAFERAFSSYVFVEVYWRKTFFLLYVHDMLL